MRNTKLTRLLAALLFSCLFALFVDQLRSADWSNWRGPSRTGVSTDTGLPASWSDDPKSPENFLWKAPYGCRTTPIVMNGRVYINNQVGKGVNEQERVMCLDANTGKVLWERKFNVYHTDIVSVRLGWTYLVGDPATGNIYWQGTQGVFACFDKDGKVLWQRSLSELDGRVSGYGGRLPSPALAGDLVVVGMINSSWGDQSKGGNRLLAVNKSDGTPVWWSEVSARPATYFSTPVAAEINGQKLIITGASDGAVHALQAGTGKNVWSYTFCQGAINCSPVVSGNYVYLNHGEESPDTNVQGRVICLDASDIKDGKPKLVWQRDGVKAKFTTPIVHDGRLYVSDDIAKLWCFDALKGDVHWKFAYGRNAMGSPVWGDGKIYVGEINGKFHILQPGDTKCKELHEHYFPSPDGVSDAEVNGSPAIADGKVYFSAGDELFCIGAKKGGEATKPKVFHDIVTVEGPPKPAQLSIYPCDIETHPGSAVSLKLKVYDKDGNFLREIDKTNEVKWSLPQPPAPPGSKNQPLALQADISGRVEPGELVVKKAPAAQQGYIEAEWKGLKAKARVRVAPTLPYAEDFDKIPEGAVPAGWVNCQGKFLVRKLSDGNQVLAKVTNNDNPLIARGPCFLGTPDMANYTIESDVYGGKVDTGGPRGVWLPDVGIGACRYTLLLAGQTQKLRLVSWDAMPRVDAWIDYSWSPDTWYRLKLMAQTTGGKAKLFGKVWRKGGNEPEKWTLEYADPTPNLEGAPFLYGYVLGHLGASPGTDVFFDNVRVTPNTK
jgi:outer membrane protein assembly factor BamB